MADISKISLPSGTEYDLKDASARNGLAEKQDVINIAYLVDSSGSFLSVVMDNYGYSEADLKSMSIEELVGLIAETGITYPTSTGISDVTVAGTSVVTNSVAVIAAPVQIVRW